MKRSGKDSALYGVPLPKQATPREISSSSSVFSSHLSALIDASSKTKPDSSYQRGRPKPKKTDIFSVHNKGSRKRALADLDDADFSQKHSKSSESLDVAQWARAKRQMEEKARLYDAMKRGDVEDMDDKHLVDFDSKWAAKQAAGGGADTSSDDGSDSEADNSRVPEVIEYTDEFGRTRTGTRAQVDRFHRQQANAKSAALDADRFTARPIAPSRILHGDTIQHAAFNPDEPIAAKMAELAAKRDKEPTPPPDTHFDSTQEIRTKGAGFYQFSADEKLRKEQMDELDRMRKETKQAEKAKQDKKAERLRAVEERRKAVQAKRGKAQADKFLDGLGGEMGEVLGKTERDNEEEEEAKV